MLKYWRQFSLLQKALAVSLLAHSALLSVRLAAPNAFNRVFEDTPLEVILVNTRTNEKLDPKHKPRAIAQTTLQGGGDAETGRTSTPLPSLTQSQEGQADDDLESQNHALQIEQMQLLMQVKKALAALPPPDPRESSDSAEATSIEQHRREMSQMIAEIERRIQDENARPKKRYISPATKEAVYAIYYDALRRKVEDQGTEHFPEQSGNKLYGELTMMVTVDQDGQVLSTEIVQGSGNPALDAHAREIARSAGPFAKFNAEMLKQATQIVVVAKFRFTREDTLETQMSNSAGDGTATTPTTSRTTTQTTKQP